MSKDYKKLAKEFIEKTKFNRQEWQMGVNDFSEWLDSREEEDKVESKESHLPECPQFFGDKHRTCTCNNKITARCSSCGHDASIPKESPKEGGYDAKPYIIDFMKDLLSHQRKEIIEEVIEMAKGMKMLDWNEDLQLGHNTALEDLIKALESKQALKE